jgi:Dolichyl-phosphate-mannose-protein mannosyltransferase
MNPANRRLGFAACCLFIALAASVIPRAGIQHDEALFAVPIFSNGYIHLRTWIQHPSAMVMPYVGTVKTLLYVPIFKILGAGVWTVRLPVALIGAATIYLFFQLAWSAAGRWAALIAVFLLATDPTFILTGTFDWGPVAIEHFLLVTGCWVLLRFGSGTTAAPRRDLFLGFFCFGLALWNKATFVWALGAVSAGALAVFWPEVRRSLTRSNLAIAGAAIGLGASPLLGYNLARGGETLRVARLDDPGRLAAKWSQLEGALNGSSLFGEIVSEEWSGSPKPAKSWPGRVSGWIRNHLGERERTGFYYAFGALLLAAPWWWRSRAARFSLVFSTVGWLAMALTKDAGESAHHLVLLWPFPILFVATALASLPWRPVTLAAGCGLMLMNLVVFNQYLFQFERNGANGYFTDAIFSLCAGLPPKQPLYVADWGIWNSLVLLDQGRLDLRDATQQLKAAEVNQDSLSAVEAMVSDPNGVFLGHVPGSEAFPVMAANLNDAARMMGYRKELLRTVADSNGRPVFEVFRFVRNAP